MLTVHLFAAVAERVKAPSVVVPLPHTVAALRRTFTDTWPSLAELLPRCAVAVNHEYAADDHPLSPGD